MNIDIYMCVWAHARVRGAFHTYLRIRRPRMLPEVPITRQHFKTYRQFLRSRRIGWLIFAFSAPILADGRNCHYNCEYALLTFEACAWERSAKSPPRFSPSTTTTQPAIKFLLETSTCIAISIPSMRYQRTKKVYFAQSTLMGFIFIAFFYLFCTLDGL